MSFGFSIGDFLAVGGLIVKVVDALRDTRSEYQELIRELESFRRALTQVEKLKGHGDQVTAVNNIKSIAITCRYPIEQFLEKVQKYDKSLGAGKSVGVIKDTGRKFQYACGKTDEANKLRSYLQMHTQIINMLLIKHGLDLLNAASEQRDRNQEELRYMIEDSSRELVELKGDLESQTLAIRRNSSLLWNLWWMVSSQIAAPFQSLSQTVAKLNVSTQQIYTMMLEMRDGARGIDTRFTYFQSPVRVEDPLGRVFPFPSECSVEALIAEIMIRIRTDPSTNEVIAGESEFFTAKNTDQLLTRSGQFVLLPGISIHMRISFERDFFPPHGNRLMPHCASKTFIKEISSGTNFSEHEGWFDFDNMGVEQQGKPHGMEVDVTRMRLVLEFRNLCFRHLAPANFADATSLHGRCCPLTSVINYVPFLPVEAVVDSWGPQSAIGQTCSNHNSPDMRSVQGR